MILINSYLHRNTFCDIIRRWMHDQAYSSDADLITRLVHFNSAYISRYLQLFSQTVLSNIHGNHSLIKPATQKRDLKDLIIANPPYTNERIEQLIIDYRSHPERFYIETPFHGTLFFLPSEKGDRYIGSNRIKRVRRLAERCARLQTKSVFEAIKRRAEALAENRSRRLGISRDQLVTDPEEMIKEFLKAENRLLDDFRNRRPIHFDDELVINDVAGIKIIVEDPEYPRVLKLLHRTRDCDVIEEQPCVGQYNANNLIVRYTPQKDKILSQPLSQGMLELIKNRGLDPESANHEFVDFVRDGEDEVHIEVIISNYQEMLESEIGRSMHEDRIIKQRLEHEYHGNLAKNVEYLMVYLFNLAVSPQSDIGELPIKLWNRYLPDYFDEVIRSMFNIPPVRLVE